ncbi:MAG: ribosome-associated translation inhibitor RaiA [Oscillospiraceae bacterium]|nr:ribosome-associated translation inhibitor RaiA [Oscillospiraceae bacterium]
MKIITTGRKVNLKPNFLNLVEEKLGKLDKFFPAEVQANVTVTVEKDWQTVEIAIKDRNASFRSEKSAPQMEVALEAAVEKLEALIVKNKSKISRKHKGNSYKYEELPVLPTGEEEEEEYEVVRKKVFNLEPQSVDDAILEMNMLDHTFFMFKDIVTGEINVVYKRKDGKYGLLLPE